MTEKVHAEFVIVDGQRDKFLSWLQSATEADAPIMGYRADDYVSRRAALVSFVDQMEVKLRKNDHKKNWREKPIEALLRLLLLEIEEFKVAHEFFSVSESRPELVDIANFALICWDRLGLLEQERNAREQTPVST